MSDGYKELKDLTDRVNDLERRAETASRNYYETLEVLDAIAEHLGMEIVRSATLKKKVEEEK